MLLRAICPLAFWHIDLFLSPSLILSIWLLTFIPSVKIETDHALPYFPPLHCPHVQFFGSNSYAV